MKIIYDEVQYAHIRDSLNNMRGTVAFVIKKEVDADVVYYGMTIVSPSEPFCKISYERARNKAYSRCTEAVHGSTVPWGVYASDRGIVHTHGDLSTFQIIRNEGFNKLGQMPLEEFGNRVKAAKAASITI